MLDFSRYHTLMMQIGPIVTPLPSASVFGLNFYTVIVARFAEIPNLLVGAIALCAALGLEVVAAISGHTMVTNYKMGNYGRAVIAAVCLIVYAVFGAYEDMDVVIRSFAITTVFWLAFAVAVSTSQEIADLEIIASDQRQIEASNTEHERQIELQRQQAQAQLELRKLELSAAQDQALALAKQTAANERAAERQAAKLASATGATGAKSAKSATGATAKASATVSAMNAQELSEFVKMSVADAMEKYGKSKRTIINWRKHAKTLL